MSMIRPLVFAGPSGSGKSTLVKRLIAEYTGCFAFSVSHTTRKPRPGEVEGQDYHFVSREAMLADIVNDQFIEHGEFAGNLYGTSKNAIEYVTKQQRACVLDIDIEGVKKVKKSHLTDLNPRYIFVKPPNLDTLEKRLRDRGTEDEQSLVARLAKAQFEMNFAEIPGNFDHRIINDELDVAL